MRHLEKACRFINTPAWGVVVVYSEVPFHPVLRKQPLAPLITAHTACNTCTERSIICSRSSSGRYILRLSFSIS